MNNKENINTILTSIYSIVEENIECEYQLFLFGSRASGTNSEKADIDVGIIPEQSLSSKQIQTIKGRIEEIPTLLKIDFVDFTTVNDDFKSVALKETKEIKI